MRTSLITVLILTLALPAGVDAQSVEGEDQGVDTEVVSLDGPRFGITFLHGWLADTLKNRYNARNPITQFGWQFEKQIFRVDDGLRGLTEFVLLVGGLDQGLVIPSLTWLVGLRNKTGIEFGVGPSGSPAGISLAMAGGVSIRRGGVNFPINLAYVSGRGGERISLLTGFNIRKSGR
jgi:hypothetical protein